MNLPNIITNPQFQPAPGVVADPRAGAATALLAYIHGDPALSIPAHGCDGSPFFTEVVKAFQTIWNANTNIGVLVPDGNYDAATQAAVRDTVTRFHLPFQPGDELCTALAPLPLPGLQPPPAVTPAPVIPPGTQVTQSTTQSWFQQNKTTIMVVGGIGLAGLLGYALYSASRKGGSSGARENPVRRGARCPRGMQVQTLIFSRGSFGSASDALRWAENHGYRALKVDHTPESYRVRQYAPSHFDHDSFRTITFGPGIKAVVGCPR